MDNSIVILGYLVLVLAWLIELLYIWSKKESKITMWFVFFYIIGMGILTYDQYMMGITQLALVNIFNLVIPVLVLLELSLSKGKSIHKRPASHGKGKKK